MKLLLEIRGKPSAGDILAYDERNECWDVVKKDEFLAIVRKEAMERLGEEMEYRRKNEEKLVRLNERISKINDQLNIVAKAIGGK